MCSTEKDKSKMDPLMQIALILVAIYYFFKLMEMAYQWYKNASGLQKRIVLLTIAVLFVMSRF